jgi:uncharacterized protein (TIGR00251 family)
MATEDWSRLAMNATPDGVELAVKAVPGASRTAIVGLWDQALKIAVAAPPEGGKANDAIVRLLATLLGVRRGAVAIVSGTTRPLKRLHVSGVTAQEVLARLEHL